ncbi:hypothetical protein [uncultured Actinomyces sp.]|uniref:hypothetical protein n=1 Tax=uncultured Actinomyces sp. TaxID=249061 RepID=UPI002604EAEF|nr:hypothetical protein [uncultured Actinomyces sp.]
MQIIQFNYKTVTNLLKKSVEEYWLNDKDAWLKFTDGSVVCIHLLKHSWSAYVTLDKLNDERASRSFQDDQSVWQFIWDEDEDEPYTSRTVSIYFDNARYYCHENHYDYTKREYLPVIEFHYYEKGEEVARNDS